MPLSKKGHLTTQNSEKSRIQEDYIKKIFFLLLILLPLNIDSLANNVPNIRIALQKNLKTIELIGAEIEIKDRKNDARLYSGVDVTYTVLEASQNGIIINGIETESENISLSSPDSIFKLNRKEYKGKFEIQLERNNTFTVINELPIEDYLVGLINAEISSKWNIEAVKAQAVIARTYALYQKYNNQYKYYDLESTVLDQVYDGTGIEDSRSRYAVETTKGEVLTYKGEIIKSFYHSNCGGKTEEPIFVWDEDLPYLKSVKDNYCRNSAPNTFWNYQISKTELEDKLTIFGYNIKNIKKIDIIEKSPSGRILELEIKGNNKIKISGKKFREGIGYDNIKSTNFEIKNRDNIFFLKGIGYGHGVGLCQWGAKGMADSGYNYKEILKHYYNRVKIEKRYE